MSVHRPPVYLDYHATTPVAPEVLEVMLPYFSSAFGNPASRSHAFGWQASEAVEVARGQVASLINAAPSEIFFTSGSTEGLNMAIKGLAEARSYAGKHIVTVSTEHHAVLDPLHWLKRKGYEVTFLPVARDGLIQPDDLEKAIRKDTIVVVVMWANNETGVSLPVETIGEVCLRAGIPFVCDATQAAGKINIDVKKAGIAILSLSAHKMYGPKGAGAVFIDHALVRPLPVPLLHGGGHESGLRSGTLNVPGIAGMGAAAKMVQRDLEYEVSRISTLRDRFESRMLSNLEEVAVNGNVIHRLPTVSNLMIRFVDSQAVMSRFRSKLAISSGSACSSADPQPSHVLLAMGLSPAEAKASFRISLGRLTTGEEIDLACDILIEAVIAERSLSPVWEMYQKGINVSEWE